MEKSFEKLTSIATAILGNSVTFILALCLCLDNGGFNAGYPFSMEMELLF